MEAFKEIYKDYEENRSGNHSKDILSMLKRAGENGVTNTELIKITHRFGGTIFNLRMSGYKIELTNMGDGIVLYTLKRNTPSKVGKVKGIDLVANEIEVLGGRVSLWDLMNILEDHNLHIIHKPNGINGKATKMEEAN